MSSPGGAVVQIAFDDVPRRELRNGAWSKLSLSQDRLARNTACLGYASFPPSSVTEMVVHDAEELFFIVQGSGEVRLAIGALAFLPLDAFYVPAGAWHAIANTGDIDVVTVFGFPTPDYPGTEAR
jgi:mannose-6-phosphate isomerase-like protein (cupin superfamily)